MLNDIAPLAKFPSDLLYLPWKGVFLPLHSDVWPGFLRASCPGSSTFLFWNENMIFSWRILMRVVILILPVVLGWVSGVATPSRDACRGYSVGRAKFNSYRRMHAGFLFFLNWRLPLCFDTIGSPDVSGLASDEATLAPVACGGRSDCRELSSFLILFWTCVTHVRYLYRVWAFFYSLFSIPKDRRVNSSTVLWNRPYTFELRKQ